MTSTGARWILLLVAVNVAIALFVWLVVLREEPRHSSRSSSSAPSSQSRTDRTRTRASTRPPGGDPRADRASRRRTPAVRMDRRRLAELLRRSAPRPRLGPGPMAGDPDRGRRAATEDGDPAGEDDPVFPISAKGIRGAIRERIAEIKECYDGWLAADDTLGGKLTLAFTIEADTDGELARISNAAIQGSTVEHAGLERCVLVMAESLRFEAPDGGKVTVRYPFRFRAADGPPPD